MTSNLSPFICPKCKERGKRHQGRAICESCVSNAPKEKAHMQGFSELSQTYLSKKL